jgi:hypothetical protein
VDKAVQEDLAFMRQMLGHQGRQVDAEVDVGAFGHILGHAGGHLDTGQTFRQ